VFRKEQDAFEMQNMGRFERVFPLSVREAAQSNQNAQENDRLSA
jgi:hypothetical protein